MVLYPLRTPTIAVRRSQSRGYPLHSLACLWSQLRDQATTQINLALPFAEMPKLRNALGSDQVSGECIVLLIQDV